MLTLKELAPVRLLKNKFYDQIESLYKKGEANPENLKSLLGKGRTKIGMFDGNLDEGKLEIGQIASVIDKIQPVAEIFAEILQEYRSALDELVMLNNQP